MSEEFSTNISADLELGTDWPQPPTEVELLDAVELFYGANIERTIPLDQSRQQLRMRNVALALLCRVLKYSSREALIHLNYSNTRGLRVDAFRQRIARDQFLAAEVDYLSSRKPSCDLTSRILLRVAQATGHTPQALTTGTEPDSLQARHMIAALMWERGYLNREQIANFFSASPSYAKRAANEIQYRQASDPLVGAQIEWVRQNILNDKPTPFYYKPTSKIPKPATTKLPPIPPDVVHPSNLAKIYDHVQAVANYYNLSPLDVIGRRQLVWYKRARWAALLLCDEDYIFLEEVAACFGGRPTQELKESIQHARQYAKSSKQFNQELAVIRQKQMPPNTLRQVLSRVKAYYGVTKDQLGDGRNYYPNRATKAFVLIASGQASLDDICQAINVTREVAQWKINNTRREIKTDQRLQAEITYLSNPQAKPKPPTAGDILAHIYETTGMTEQTLQHPQTPAERRIRQLGCFVLVEELNLPYQEVAQLIAAKASTVANYILKTNKELKVDFRLRLELDNLLPPHAVSLSAASLILAECADKYKVTTQELTAATSVPWHLKVKTAVKTRLKQAGYTPTQISQLLALP